MQLTASPFAPFTGICTWIGFRVYRRLLQNDGAFRMLNAAMRRCRPNTFLY